MKELCTGRLPQSAIISRAQICPELVLGDGTYTDVDYACPPNVPLFTSAEGLRKMANRTGTNMNGKRSRTAGDDSLIPVIAAIPASASGLIFAGISYNGGSRSRPIVSIVTGGQMPLPHAIPADQAHTLVGNAVWWDRSPTPYGGSGGPHIAVPSLNPSTAFVPEKTRAICGIMVQQATHHDCAVLLGVPRLA